MFYFIVRTYAVTHMVIWGQLRDLFFYLWSNSGHETRQLTHVATPQRHYLCIWNYSVNPPKAYPSELASSMTGKALICRWCLQPETDRAPGSCRKIGKNGRRIRVWLERNDVVVLSIKLCVDLEQSGLLQLLNWPSVTTYWNLMVCVMVQPTATCLRSSSIA